ncbi:hypothetical protein N7535_003370 [Penicillium sp. DV-2018c]|nr:hypothetical protein N7535_003370 [Penicillium sp. DV-2018c]
MILVRFLSEPSGGERKGSSAACLNNFVLLPHLEASHAAPAERLYHPTRTCRSWGPLGSGLGSGPISRINRQLTSSRGTTTVHQRHPPGAGPSLPTSRRPAPQTLGIPSGQVAEMHHALPAPGGPPGGHQAMSPGSWPTSSDISAAWPTNTEKFTRAGRRDASYSTSSRGTTWRSSSDAPWELASFF